MRPGSKRARRGRPLVVLGVVFLTAACLVAAYALLLWHECSPSPDPDVSADAVEKDDDGFPKVKWGKWEKINPDVVAWISIPGTDVSYPVCVAPEGDSDYYLTHNVYRRWSPFGALYIDAECEDGMESDNVYIYGHHMNDGSMLACVASFASSKSWGKGRKRLLVQTREWKRVFFLDGAEVVNGYHAAKQSAFDDEDALRAWRGKRLKACRVTYGHAKTEDATQMVSLVTCSYTTFQNERTVAYFSQP